MKNNNEPAFPAIHSLSDGVSYSNGMTLRDYFASKALAGFCNSKDILLASQEHAEMVNKEESTVIAEMCYELADAMLAERNKDA